MSRQSARGPAAARRGAGAARGPPIRMGSALSSRLGVSMSISGGRAAMQRLGLACLRVVMENQYLAGMLVMAAGPALAQSLNALISHASRLAAGVAWTRVTIGKAEAEDLREWLRNQPRLHNGSNLKLCPRSDADSDSSTSDHRIFDYEPELESSLRVRFRSAATGRVCFLWLEMPTIARDVPAHDDAAATITVLGRDKAVIKELLMEGRRLKRDKLQKYLHVITVYNYKQDDYGLGWNHGRPTDKKPPGRSIDSVILAPRISGSGGSHEEIDQARALLEDAREFLGAERWYADRGIPYRRGYLLHGMPGGGKSSLVMAIASELKLPIYLLTLSSDQMCDDALLQLMQTMTTTPSILLLEDVDAAHTAVAVREIDTDIGVDSRQQEQPLQTEEEEGEMARGEQSAAMMISITERLLEQHKDEGKQRAREREQEREEERGRRGNGRLTLSGLLNALDGPTATMGRLLFMTTNHKSLIDSALLRSGRIDYELSFGAVTQRQCERLFSRFYCDYSPIAAAGQVGSAKVRSPASKRKHPDLEIEGMAREFAMAVHSSGLQLSAADVQGHLMRHKKSPPDALRSVFAELLGAATEESPSSGSGRSAGNMKPPKNEVSDLAEARAEIASLRQTVAAAQAEITRMGAMVSNTGNLPRREAQGTTPED